ELFFHARRERRVHELELALKETLDDHASELRRAERTTIELLDVVARLHLADDLGVGRRTTDAAIFELADERAFVVPRRRLRELLLREHARRCDELEGLALLQLGKVRFA